MSSASEAPLGSRLAGVALLVLAAGAGAQRPAATDVADSPLERVPVGPIPGPGAMPVLPANPHEHDLQAIQQGRELYVGFNCYGCHGAYGGGGMGPSLRDELWLHGSEPARIYDSIASGRSNGMPAWGTHLPPKEIWKLVAYIQSLRTPREPDPPK